MYIGGHGKDFRLEVNGDIATVLTLWGVLTAYVCQETGITPERMAEELPGVVRDCQNAAPDMTVGRNALQKTGMTLEQVLQQLESIRDNARDSLTGEDDEIWQKDIQACDAAVAILSCLRGAPAHHAAENNGVGGQVYTSAQGSGADERR